MIRECEKTIYFVGGGAVISGASEELARFVELVDAPVMRFPDGKRCIMTEPMIDTPECLACMERRLPIYGVSECDLLIVVGARFQRPCHQEMPRNLQAMQRFCSLT